MMKNNRFALIMIFTTIVVLAWIGFGFYHTIVSSTLTPDVAESMQRIAPKFNQRAIDTILGRKQIPPTYEAEGIRSSSSAQESLPTPSELLEEEDEVIASDGATSL